MNLKDTMQAIRVLLSSEPVEVKLEQMTLVDGVTIIEAESFEPGAAVFIVTETENVALPIGDYELEGGMILTVEEEGIIASIEAMPEEEAEEEMPAEESTETEEQLSEVELKVIELEKRVDDLVSQLKLSKETLTEKDSLIEGLNVKLSELPAAKKVVNAPVFDKTMLSKGKAKGSTNPFNTILSHIDRAKH